MATKKNGDTKKKKHEKEVRKNLHDTPDGPSIVEMWEKQDDEVDEAFAAFKIHLDQGSDRTTPKTAKLAGQKISLIQKWAWQWSWKKRITAWERYEWQQLRKIRLEEVLAMRKRHADIAKSMLDKVAARLATKIQDVSENDFAKLTAPQLAQWVDVAAKLERLSLGEPTELSGHVETEQEAQPSTAIFRDPEVRRGLDQAAARIACLARDAGGDGGAS